MPKYDPEEAKVLYLCGMSIADVAAEYDVPKTTMYSFLVSEGIEIRPDSAAQKKDTCARNHSMEDSIPKKGGGRECRKCKQERDRRYKRAKTQRKAAASEFRHALGLDLSDDDRIQKLRAKELSVTSAPTNDQTSIQTLEGMEQEVFEVNDANGWHGGERSVLEGAMLIITEVAEAVEAFRSWGLEDMTGKVGLDKALTDPRTGEVLQKPEGVGSEYADIFIRLLDQCRRDGIDLRAEYERKLAYNRLRGHMHGGKSI